MKATIIWILFAFLSLGFLIGNLVGLTAESVTSTILALLFAFGGGSALAFVQKLEPKNLKLVSVAIIALSWSCLAGIYSGIRVSEYQMLSPQKEEPVSKISIEDKKYLRENITSKANLIDQRLANGHYNFEEAYRELYKTTQELP